MSEQGIKFMGRDLEGKASPVQLNKNNELVVSGGTSEHKELFPPQNVEPGEFLETEVLSREEYTHGTFNLMVVGPRKVKISIQYYGRGDGRDLPAAYEVLLDETNGEQRTSYQVTYPLLSDLYRLKIENVDVSYGRFSKMHEIKSYRQDSTGAYNIDGIKNDVSTIKNTIVDIGNLVDAISNQTKSNVVTKRPSSNLTFKKSSLEVEKIARYNNHFYVIGTDRVINKYENIIDESNAVETGFAIPAEYGEIKRLIVTTGGIAVFTDHDSGAHIYYSPSMQDDLQLAYSSSDDGAGGDSWWQHGFGIKHYDNGINSYILAGVYGKGRNERDLILSKNGGQSFEVIKKTKNVDSVVNNSHWHDVAFDVYSGFIWATEGDGNNKEVFYSEDMGINWVSVGTEQPTAIIPTPDRIILGRDGGLVGVDYVNRPTTVAGRTGMEIKELADFRDKPAGAYFAASPFTDGEEIYLSFYQFDTGWGDNRILFASGDFGATWHGIFLGETNNFMVLAEIDEQYIYAYGYNKEIYYAKKPSWI